MTDHPPSEFPPVLLTQEHDPPLRLAAEGPGEIQGHPATSDVFRDVILDTRVTLLEGADTDLYGVFLRQSGDRRFIAWGMSPARRCVIGAVDGGLVPYADAEIAPDIKFATGTGQANRFQVVACGPSLTFVLNGMVVTGVTVDPRYQEGYLGHFVVHGGQDGRAELAADWLQVRAVLPGQLARERDNRS